MLKIKEGMDSLPKRLVQNFLRDSDRHKLSLNRSLSSIEKLSSNEYLLQLRKTKTVNGITFETGSEEFLCAKKVILALPKVALIKIWSPILKNPEISKAIEAVRLVPVSKIIMAFKQQHWTKDPMAKSSTKFTDETIGKIYDLGKSSKSNFYFLMASYAEGDRVRPLEEINLEGPAISGSAEGVNQVTVGLKDEILKQLKKVFNNPDFENPQSAISKFWTKMVPVSTVWRANYHFDDTICRLQRPSLDDDVHIVGSDYAWGNTQSWTEGALESVENVLSRYFADEI
ncbi:hypothetical protein Btru_053398 [Bulinus truncatus]|nr:hypothetical protein Btru_053398 [Bulinus truncatus]